MALREEGNEENQHVWRKRFERERLGLSASVEAALVVDSTLERQWLDEFDEQEASSLATEGTSLVGQYGNRQSSLLPQVEPENLALVTTDARPVVSSATEHAELQEPRRGILTRLAQRLTSSFAAIDTSAKQETQSQPVLSEEKKQPLTQQMQVYQEVQRIDTPASIEQPAMPLVRVIDTLAVQPTGAVREDVPPRTKRSLKGNGKVRLETTELPIIASTTRTPARETSKHPLTDSTDILKHRPSSFEAERTTGETWAVVARDTLSGTGACVAGQSEVMVACSRITAASVVLVTLTSSPGPVVVQYISLQPQMGFTLHLTAPVSERTTFNYVVL